MMVHINPEELSLSTYEASRHLQVVPGESDTEILNYSRIQKIAAIAMYPLVSVGAGVNGWVIASGFHHETGSIDYFNPTWQKAAVAGAMAFYSFAGTVISARSDHTE
jgi:hypothetical protein